MLMIFLWVALPFLFLLFIIAILPVRFGVSAKYAGSERFSYEFFVSYFHPAFFKLLYSSETGNVLRVFGKTIKKKQKKESEESQSESSETLKDSGKKTAEPPMEEPERSPGESEKKSNYESESAKSQSSESIKVYEEAREETEPQGERASLFNKIKMRIDKIKRSRAYRFLSDAVWRKKAKSWFGRVLNSALKVIVFRRLKIWAKVGLMNPATLGKLCGYFCAARSALSLRGRKVDMALEPLFMKEYLEFEIELNGLTSLLRAASCFFIVVFTFPYIRTYKVWRQWKRKSNS